MKPILDQETLSASMEYWLQPENRTRIPKCNPGWFFSCILTQFFLAQIEKFLASPRFLICFLQLTPKFIGAEHLFSFIIPPGGFFLHPTPIFVSPNCTFYCIAQVPNQFPSSHPNFCKPKSKTQPQQLFFQQVFFSHSQFHPRSQYSMLALSVS